MELARYLAIIRRWWWTIVVATWAAGLVGYVTATRLPPTYESEATVLVGPVSADFETQRAAGQLVATYAEIVRSGPVVSATIQELGLSDSVSALRRQITALADSTTRFLTIRVAYDDPEAAAAIANTLYEQLEGQTTAGTIRPEGQPTLWEPADANPSPVAPDVGLIAVLAAAAGLVGALFLVTSVEYLVAPVRDPGGLEDATGVEPLGVVDTWRARGVVGRGRLIVNVAPESPASIAYRLLARRLGSLSGGMPRTITVVAPTENVGSGEVAANLAAAIALAGRRVALVDGNDEEQSLSRIVGLWGHRGLDDIADRGGPALPGLLEASGNLQIIPHGPRVSLPLIDATDARQIFDLILATGKVDIVILDGGAATRTSNALLWAGAADGTLIVAKRDQTRSSALAQASELLSLAGATVVGSVLHARRLRNIRQAKGRHAQATPHRAPAAIRGQDTVADPPMAATTESTTPTNGNSDAVGTPTARQANAAATSEIDVDPAQQVAEPSGLLDSSTSSDGRPSEEATDGADEERGTKRGPERRRAARVLSGSDDST